MTKAFFCKSAEIVAKKLLGCVIVRKIGKEVFKARIVETEAYFGEKDPGSWARLGKRKDNRAMWSAPGTILVKKVHKYPMLNFVTGKEGEPQAVLIRALEPLNFKGNCSGPGLLTTTLKIDKSFNEKNVVKNKEIWIEKTKKRKHKIAQSFRIGLKEDLPQKSRFYIKSNKFVSRREK